MKSSLNRREFLRITGTGISLLTIAGCKNANQYCGNSVPGGRPNILLITTDQQRKDSLGIYNTNPDLKINTQNIDGIAADGMIFDRGYIPHPTCTPSRASILTGQYASTHGAYTIGTALPTDCLKVTDLLKTHGYETYCIGKMHFQQVSTKGSFEGPPNIYDEQFWRHFQGPYYGFQHAIMLNCHTSVRQTAAMHYGVWLKDQGLSDADLDRFFDYNYSKREIGEWKLPRKLHPDVFVAQSTNKMIEEHAKTRSDKPFFMWTSFPGPHDPHVVPEPYMSIVDRDKVAYLGYKEGEHDNKPPIYNQLCQGGTKALPFRDKIGVPGAADANSVGTKHKNLGDETYWRKAIAIHHGSVKMIDEEIGTIVDTLKKHNLYEHTMIIFTSDHGDYLGNHGFTFKGFPAYEEVYNVPFVVKNAGQVNQNIRTNALIGHVDIAPTVLNAAGIDIPEQMHGVSQMEVFTGKRDKIRKAFVIENRAVEKGFYQKMLVTDQYKIVMYMDQDYGELYDMVTDPNQYENLWDMKSYQALKRSLLGQLLAENVIAGQNKESTQKNTHEILNELSLQMHAEEPVLPRTSYS